ncbi:malonyl-CoA:anthocyanidin 5-O-glucoside-6''-O-malonyltransferase-like [Arachis stenosperma]|uniref:malonyl-CoA:anthocyanidin 5-O-glucoside-6''-O-malonyltransferase-like n=1 Tax=Arachis stenosperma TaxID=217475 RepID=UPI0025ABC11F|nr:malonyl-CoA:anthocyanidin 5-O-glucoside-6''-O-malonyltransferase-like [Arachis stenosperma]
MKTPQVFKASPSSLGPQNLLHSSSTSLPLTFFDILWLRLPPVQRVFFYEFPHQPSLFYDTLLPKLKHSLSLALAYYFPLAGTLTWPHDSNKPIIIYNVGDTLSLILAESDADFNHLSGSDLCEASEVHHLVPELSISDDQATVLALQVTLFPNHGFSIGVTSHHAVLDGKTSTSFIKSWAYLCNKLEDSSSSPCDLPPELSPFLEREIVEDPKGLEAKYLSDWLKQGGPNNRSLKVWNLQVPQDSVRGLFKLSRSNIEKLKNFVGSRQKGNSNLHLSSFVVSLAYAWVCKTKAEETKSKKVGMAINVDCRNRLDPPLPPTYFGNCIGARVASAETREFLDEDGGVVVAVESLSSALETLKDGVLNEAETWSSLLLDGLHSDEEMKLTGAAGTPRFEVYGSDFGWGRPKKVEMVSIDRTGAISLSDSRDGDGLEVGFVSSKPSMEAFASIFAKGLLL